MKGRLFGLGLGGNTAATAGSLGKAARYLVDHMKGGELRFSSVYRTPPWGDVQGGEFLNCVAVGEWPASDRALLHVCREMEALCGAPVRKNGAARSLDVDILFLEGGVSVEEMIVPHPRMHLRRFVLVPLAEVLSEPVPGLGLTPEVLLARTGDDSRISLYEGAALAWSGKPLDPVGGEDGGLVDSFSDFFPGEGRLPAPPVNAGAPRG